MHRRQFVQCAGAAAALPVFATMARAQSYPSHPVRLLVGFPPNGPNSILAGIAGQWLAVRLGQPVAIEHRPGQSGNIATAEAVRAPADGYTLLLCGPANAIGASLYPNLPYNFLRDMTPVAGITREALVLVVHPQLPVTSAGELIARARADSSAVKIASTGAGSAPHVTAELFKQMTGLKLEMVHYAGGGPALNAVASGEAQMMFEPMSAAIVPVHSGKLRALAVTTAAPSRALPGIPTLAEAVPGYEASAVTGIAVPKDTPDAVVETLNSTMQLAFSDPGFKARLVETGGEPLPGSAAAFSALMAAETEKWGRVVKAAGIRAD
jgi:tripartite-type tricarboxylate transporter receptor subunit TctC